MHLDLIDVITNRTARRGHHPQGRAIRRERGCASRALVDAQVHALTTHRCDQSWGFWYEDADL